MGAQVEDCCPENPTSPRQRLERWQLANNKANFAEQKKLSLKSQPVLSPYLLDTQSEAVVGVAEYWEAFLDLTLDWKTHQLPTLDFQMEVDLLLLVQVNFGASNQLQTMRNLGEVERMVRLCQRHLAASNQHRRHHFQIHLLKFEIEVGHLQARDFRPG